uniref:Uncharacterized protein n=1 Tax=Paramoeba aestuarina TaxID=180227 RepID=A0A7S4NJ37_9EUKA|mmetsp:Transcript_16911/g.26358  ORF Transcript_16911/g.26358 Transcript_16911/m.26358 type:complete len:209 (+) Transcript_16911:818-1444(+)
MGVRGVFWRESMGREVWVSCGNASFTVFSLRDELTLSWLLTSDPYPSCLSPCSPLTSPSPSPLSSPPLSSFSPLSSPCIPSIPSLPFPLGSHGVPKSTFRKWVKPVVIDYPLEMSRRAGKEGERKILKKRPSSSSYASSLGMNIMKREIMVSPAVTRPGSSGRRPKRPKSSVGTSLMRKGMIKEKERKKGGSHIGPQAVGSETISLPQ